MAIKADLIPFENIFAIPLRNGLTRPKAVRGKGVKMINMGELFAHSRINNVETDRVPFSANENSFLLKSGDLLFARQSLVLAGAGKCSIFVGDNEEVTYEGHIIRARINSKIADPFFFYYFFNSPVGRQTIESIVEQVAAAGIRGSDLAKLNVPCPSLIEQHAIAMILGALDDKIEVNHRMNATLESMARAVFRSWFIEFEPVRAKADGSQPLGMDQETAALFPKKFKNTEIGDIPSSWDIASIKEVAERVAMGPFGSSIKVETFVDEGIPIISGPHLRGFMLNDSAFNFVSLEHAEKLKNANVYRGDIIFTHAGNIGNLAFIPEDSEYTRYIVSQRQFYMRCNLQKVTPSFITLYFQSPEGQHKLLANMSSVGVPSIAQPVSYLRSIKLPIPPKPILDEFESFVSPLLRKYRSNVRESRTLGSLRNSLLPKLMRGEVRVKYHKEINHG